MIRQKHKILLTETDQQRFTFYHEEDANSQALLKKFRSTYMIGTGILMAAMVGIVILIIQQYSKGAIIGPAALAILDGALIFINYSMYHDSVKKLKRFNDFIEVQILEKLPIEKEINKHAGKKSEPIKYYPVRARDTEKKNYTSVCYLTEKEYETFKVGDKIRLCVPANH